MSRLYAPYSMMLQRFYQLPFLFQVMEVYGPGDGVRFHQFDFLLPFRSQIKGMQKDSPMIRMYLK